MHRVVAQHMKDFSEQYPTYLEGAKLFEAFSAFCILKRYSNDDVDVTDLVYNGSDPGIDSILVLVDDYYVSSLEEFEQIISSGKRDKDVSIIFIQSKSGESWNKGEINKFQSAIQDFCDESQVYPADDYLKERREIFDTVIRRVGKIRGGKPRFYAYFVTTGPQNEAAEISGALQAIYQSMTGTGLFLEVEVHPVGRDDIIGLWQAADGSVEATLPVLASAAFPKVDNVEESYVATVRAKDFVQYLLKDDAENLRKSIFEENVRDFIGSDAEINTEIASTAKDKDKQKLFGILNNGITIISPDVRVQGQEIFLADYQIVNGCQTSHVLFENSNGLSDAATLMVKIIETDNTIVIEDIVRSTNRQTKVQDDQFLATLASIKAISRYFEARGADLDHALYFERRSDQYTGEPIPNMRVFGIRDVARCVGAMFFDRPDLATRYPNRLTGELRDLVFNAKNIEEIYYTACYAYYRLQLHFSNKRIDPKYRRFQWHLLMAIKYELIGEKVPNVQSKSIEISCKKIYEFMKKGDDSISKINKITDIFNPVEEITRDRIKGQSYTTEVRSALFNTG